MKHLKLFLIVIGVVLLTTCNKKEAKKNEGITQLAETEIKNTSSNSIKAGAKEDGHSDMVAESVENKESEYLTFSKALSMVNPQKVTSQQEIEKIFGDIGLRKLHAEHYDEDWGGNSPAINFCWGYGVEYKDYTNLNMKVKADVYYGVNLILFLDVTHKSGHICEVRMITSYKTWYEKFMKDAKQAKFVYSKEDTELMDGKVYTVDIDGYNYYIEDSSENGKYKIAIGYNSGVDV